MVREVTAAQEVGQLVVRNDYRWLLNPRWGAFHVYVDGRATGIAPLGGALSHSLPEGDHRVRVRLWFYLSLPIGIELSRRQPVILIADFPRSGIARFFNAMFRPWAVLELLGTTEWRP